MAKFCTRCGRKLEEGEVCNCRNENMNPQADGSMPKQADGMPGNQSQYDQRDTQQYQGAQNQQYQGDTQQYQNSQNQQYQNPQHQQYQDPQNQQYQNTQNQQFQNQQQYQGQNQYGQQRNPNQGMTREAEWFNQKKDAFVSGTKNMFSQIGPILKEPVTAVKRLSTGSPAVGMELIIAKAVLVLAVVLILLMRISSALGGYIELPYFKIIVMTVLITAGVDFLEAFLMKVFSGVFNGITNLNAMITTVGARALYECFLTVLVFLCSLVSVNVAFVIYVLGAVLLPYIQYSGFHAVVQVKDDKKPYIFFLAKACIIIVIYIVVYLFAKDILMSMAGGMGGILGSVL